MQLQAVLLTEHNGNLFVLMACKCNIPAV